MDDHISGLIILAVFAVWLLIRHFHRIRVKRQTHDHIHFISSHDSIFFFNKLCDQLYGTSYSLSRSELSFFEYIFSQYRSYMEHEYLKFTERNPKRAKLSDIDYFMLTFYWFLDDHRASFSFGPHDIICGSRRIDDHTVVWTLTEFGNALYKLMFAAAISCSGSGLFPADFPFRFLEWLNTGEVTLVRYSN